MLLSHYTIADYQHPHDRVVLIYISVVLLYLHKILKHLCQLCQQLGRGRPSPSFPKTYIRLTFPVFSEERHCLSSLDSAVHNSEKILIA